MSKKRQIRRAELKNAEKRKRELLRRKKRMQKLMAMSIMLIAIIGIVTFISMSDSPDDYGKSSEPAQSSDFISDTEVGIPVSDISNKPKFYSYDANGIDVKYFAVKGSDGDVHVAFDACDVCYGEKKGYRQNGADMQCINCGNRYPINSVGTENIAGGCWPSYLPIKIYNEQIIIEKSNLEQKRWMF